MQLRILICILSVLLIAQTAFARTGYETVALTGEKREAFISASGPNKQLDVKLLNQSAGRTVFNFATELLNPIAKSKGYVGHIGFFGIFKSFEKGKYGIEVNHIEVATINETSPSFFRFEGIDINLDLRVEGFLDMSSEDWTFEVKALTKDDIVFYEIVHIQSRWAKDIVEAHPTIKFGDIKADPRAYELP